MNDKQKRTYLIHLRQYTEESRLIYILNRNKVKTILKNAQSDSWDHFISNTKNYLHGSQHMVYKALIFLNSKEQDNANNHVIEEKGWIEYYRQLWFNEQRTSEETGDFCENPDEIELIEEIELDGVLKTGENSKTTGVGRINFELFKYAETSVKTHPKHLIYVGNNA